MTRSQEEELEEDTPSYPSSEEEDSEYEEESAEESSEFVEETEESSEEEDPADPELDPVYLRYTIWYLAMLTNNRGKMPELRQQAAMVGATEDEIEGARDAGNPKHAMIALISAKSRLRPMLPPAKPHRYVRLHPSSRRSRCRSCANGLQRPARPKTKLLGCHRGKSMPRKCTHMER